jgi:hypothetical protein
LQLNTSSLQDWSTYDNPLAFRLGEIEYNKKTAWSTGSEYIDFDFSRPAQMTSWYFSPIYNYLATTFKNC